MKTLLIIAYVISYIGTYYYMRYTIKKKQRNNWYWDDVIACLIDCVVPGFIFVIKYVVPRIKDKEPPKWL